MDLLFGVAKLLAVMLNPSLQQVNRPLTEPIC